MGTHPPTPCGSLMGTLTHGPSTPGSGGYKGSWYAVFTVV